VRTSTFRSSIVAVIAVSLASAACAASSTNQPAGPPVTTPSSAAPPTRAVTTTPDVIAAPADDAATMTLGRRTAGAFFARETHALWERFTPPLRAKVGSEEGMAAFRASAEKQLGAESAVLSERVEHTSGIDLYIRIAKYERIATPIKMLIGFDAERNIAAFGIAPEGKLAAASTTKSDYRTQAALRLPFEGAWNVAWGGRTIEQNQHAATSDQRFAYDFLVVEGGTTHRGDGRRNEDYFAYGRSVLAPAAGRVVVAVDGVPDNVPGSMDTTHLAGNHVIVDHGNGEFSLLAHLAPGSVTVKPGDQVTAGEKLGRCGNSGHSSEPHLHYHLQNTARLSDGEGLPAPFVGYVADGARVARGEPVRDQRIEAAPGTLAGR
jgi:murein DD-endopeptidase MepM/ murein hydrolase activator NlpD